MKEAIVFIKRRQTSIISSKEELIKEINDHQAYWLTNTGDYVDEKQNVVIKVHGLTYEDRGWLASRMRMNTVED